MKLKTLLPWMLLFQCASIVLSLLVLHSGRTIVLEADRTDTLGGSITMVLILLGLICHFQSKKGRVRLEMLAVMGLTAPLFALINGPPRQVIGYHVIVLGIYGFLLWNFWRGAKSQSPETPS